ncbi:MAG: nuclear transport factor 2 family protein [Alphaproteobacteria bacterium]|nr:nuclear transport factor 2 family protein [Alphaproteobacteria bacterium]
MSSLPARLAEYTAALNRHDLDVVERMFAEDALYLSPGLPAPMRGRAAIMAAFRAYFAQHTDQVNGDEDVRPLGTHSIEARWWLSSSTSSRMGTQRITFNDAGEITRIEVVDG